MPHASSNRGPGGLIARFALFPLLKVPHPNGLSVVCVSSVCSSITLNPSKVRTFASFPKFCVFKRLSLLSESAASSCCDAASLIANFSSTESSDGLPSESEFSLAKEKNK